MLPGSPEGLRSNLRESVYCREVGLEMCKVGERMSGSHRETCGGRCAGQCKGRGVMNVCNFEMVMFGGVDHRLDVAM